MNQIQKEQFIKLTHFLGEVLGKHYEVVFHVVEKNGAYVAAIANGHVSGRSVNAPLTAFASELVQNKSYLQEDFLCNYKALVDNSKTVRGSTFFIKNQNKLVGILCINHDISELKTVVEKIIDLEHLGTLFSDLSFLHSPEKSTQKIVEGVENLSHSIEEILAENIDLKFLESGFSLSVQQKNDMIKTLYHKGIFNIKGAIPQVAKLLGLSEPSIYRYLRQFKQDLKA